MIAQGKQSATLGKSNLMIAPQKGVPAYDESNSLREYSSKFAGTPFWGAILHLYFPRVALCLPWAIMPEPPSGGKQEQRNK